MVYVKEIIYMFTLHPVILYIITLYIILYYILYITLYILHCVSCVILYISRLYQGNGEAVR